VNVLSFSLMLFRDFSFFDMFTKFLVPEFHVIIVETGWVWNGFHFFMFVVGFIVFFTVGLVSFVFSCISAATTKLVIIISSKGVDQWQI